MKLCVSAFFNVFYNIYAKICGIPVNVSQIPEKCLSYS